MLLMPFRRPRVRGLSTPEGSTVECCSPRSSGGVLRGQRCHGHGPSGGTGCSSPLGRASPAAGDLGVSPHPTSALGLMGHPTLSSQPSHHPCLDHYPCLLVGWGAGGPGVNPFCTGQPLASQMLTRPSLFTSWNAHFQHHGRESSESGGFPLLTMSLPLTMFPHPHWDLSVFLGSGATGMCSLDN